MVTNPLPIAVSPNFTAAKLQNPTIEDKIDVFEDRVYGWVLNHAKFLASPQNPENRHCGIAVLMLVASYFESLAAFVSGESSERRSGEFFALGLKNVFPDIFNAAKEEDPANADRVYAGFARVFYSELRCGLFHDAMIRGRILIHPNSTNLGETGLGAVIDTGGHKLATILIDPARFLAHIERHFARYVNQLRDQNEQELRRNFERAWDGRMTRPGAVLSEEWFSVDDEA